MNHNIKPYWQNYINGQWRDGGAGKLDVCDPSTGELIAEQALADEADVDTAVMAALRCHESGVLTDMRPVVRGRMVRKIGDYLLDHFEEIATVLTLESGKPLWEARIEVTGAARYFEYYGNQAETFEGRSIPLGSSYFDFTVHEPYGVSAQIIPWNYPLEMSARSMSAALATGNACVVKTPELDPLSNQYLAKAAEFAGFPDGAVNILCGFGHTAGAALVQHEAVCQIVFTGSVATGISIATAAARNVVPCILELGGKSAAVVYPDTEMDLLVDSVRWGIFYNAGQVCSAMSRLIVHEDIHDEVLQRLISMAGALSTGPGIDLDEMGPNMGAMISEKQRDRALGMCAQAEAEGGRISMGGKAMDRPGWFFAPTIISEVQQSQTIAQEEVFGPVLSVLKFSQDEEAVKMANATQYGLVSGVFTRDLDRAMTTARKLRAGQVYINEWYAGGVETPFGGYGKSGYGRERGREALNNYVHTKNIAVALKS